MTVLVALAFVSFGFSPAFADCSSTSPATCVYVSQLQPNNSSLVTPAFQGASPSCQKVTNNCAATIMVPTANQTEWSSFLHSSIANGGCVSISGCTTGCPSQNPTWMTNCTGPVAANSIGAQVQVTNTVAGYSGTETATCQANGTWAYSNPSCGSGVCGNLDVQFGLCGDIGPGCVIDCTTYHCDSGPYGLGPTCQGANDQWSENGHDACIHIGHSIVNATCQSNGTWSY